MPKRKRPGNRKVEPVAFKLKSRRVARQRTTHFHGLMSAHAAAAERGNAVLVETLGEAIAENRESYQHASIVSTAHFKSSKWVFQQLTALGRRPKKRCPPLRLLEVGAINTQLVEGPAWLATTAIDLESRHPAIIERDFFDALPEANYDVLVLSMVLNCVPTPEARGDMLRRCRAHLRPKGLFFLMIPLLCITNSSYTTEALLLKLLQTVGFSLVARRDTPRIAFFCLQREEEGAEGATAAAIDGAGRHQKSLRTVRKGRKRNNFAVVLEPQPAWMSGGTGGGRPLPPPAMRSVSGKLSSGSRHQNAAGESSEEEEEDEND